MGMKRSTIKMVIRNKVNDWLKSIHDEGLRDMLRDEVVVTGGCITSMLLGEKPNDYDVYLRSADAVEAIAQYYVDEWVKVKGKRGSGFEVQYTPEVRRYRKVNVKGEDEERVSIYMRSVGVAGEMQTDYKYFEQYSEEESDDFVESLYNREDKIEMSEEFLEELRDKKYKYRPVFMSENAVTLANKVQLVLRFHGEPDKIHENYDFVHTTCSYDYRAGHLQLPPEAMESILSKTLIYRGSLYPLCSMFRIRKFVERGWRITAGQMLKIAYQISHLDLDDRETLKEQLIGVDVTYMYQLLSALQNTQGRVDETYLAKLIDGIFE